MSQKRARLIAQASIVGIIANGAIAAAKISIGLSVRSYAVISDGIDSATDILTSVITLVTINFSEKPPDARHPYGHTRAETIATKFLSFVIFFAGAQLALASLRHLINPESLPLPGAAAIGVTLASILVKLFLAVYKFRIGRKTHSSMLIADAQNMRNDILISVTVLVGLFGGRYFNMPLIDPIIALLISLWILRVAFGIFLETSIELMDGQTDQEVYRQIFEAVESVDGASHPHRTRIRRIGRLQVVDLDIEVEGSLSVSQGHAISGAVEGAIKAKLSDIYDVIVHVEPCGAGEHAERYGLSEAIIDGKEPSKDQ
jgi:cation diffusion facilitator family transporter